MNTKHQDTRQHLLDTGREILAARGFSSVGLSALLQQAGVPKGSFYHYFKSKEQFGQALLEDYFQFYLTELDLLFSKPSLSSQQQLMSYWEEWQRRYCGPDSRSDCLVVKLSAEVADLSEPMRLTLKAGTNKVIERITRCIEAGVSEGSLHCTQPDFLATSLYQLWLGASLLTKLHRDEQHMNLAMNMTCQLLNTK
ncbi:TetR/AcrR family transcriptional regulator [Oceanisphaera sp. IT1-181]|uniref:TetR/AcrR family transcriptional regulator n=1 Tax=Oceanisphaera sp. IT1-181 TaxID=3081199 RepID=UPI0029CA0C28|nr:TetR/AcrR family transcriptional regulator [Oceanisphaera sp. IT1-181]